jgi:hypothetical protein
MSILLLLLMLLPLLLLSLLLLTLLLLSSGGEGMEAEDIFLTYNLFYNVDRNVFSLN